MKSRLYKRVSPPPLRWSIVVSIVAKLIIQAADVFPEGYTSSTQLSRYSESPTTAARDSGRTLTFRFGNEKEGQEAVGRLSATQPAVRVYNSTPPQSSFACTVSRADEQIGNSPLVQEPPLLGIDEDTQSETGTKKCRCRQCLLPKHLLTYVYVCIPGHARLFYSYP